MYSGICQQQIESIPEAARVLFGQPVQYGEKSFIRIALGSSELRKFVAEADDFENDSRLVQIVADWVTANA